MIFRSLTLQLVLFHFDGVSKLNCHYLTAENPSEVLQRLSPTPKLNFALSSSCAIGVYFFEDHDVTAERYTNMIHNFAPNINAITNRENLWFQQAGL